jgi:hypothetical protein
MSQLFFLDAEIILGSGGHRNLTRDALHDPDARPLESVDLLGVIRQQTHAAHPEMVENRTRKLVQSQVRFEA